MILPQPENYTSLVLRTDFTDDTAWEALQTMINSLDQDGNATYVSDQAYAGVSAQELVNADAAASDDDALTYLFLADTVTMTDPEHRLLAVDLHMEPGRTFRLPPRWFEDVAANLSIANVGFAEFADYVDASGTYRGA
jgi:hypothetical protein